jgi:hypothetical protein
MAEKAKADEAVVHVCDDFEAHHSQISVKVIGAPTPKPRHIAPDTVAEVE